MLGSTMLRLTVFGALVAVIAAQEQPKARVAADPQPRAQDAGAGRGELLCRAGDHQLRLALPGADRDPDLTVDVDHGDLAAQLALAPVR